MKAHKDDRAVWSRRDVFRVGSLATAAGVIGGLGAAEAVPGAPAQAEGAEVYTRIGVRPFINLTATLTINGGALTLAEVRDASRRAAEYAVNMDELMEKAGARIAELMGCEAAIVTSGAAAALTQATAACVAGSDPELIQQLPDLTGLRDEVIIPRESRNVYDHAFRALGVRMVEVDTAEAFHAAIGPRTAMVAVLGSAEAEGAMRLEDMAAAAHKAGVPVLVDAAPELPRRPHQYLSRGADLVAHSGGKVLRGPQCAGLLLGRKDLVWAAFMNGAPHHSVGRMMKVGKEEVLGMLAAVEVLMTRGIDDDFNEWKSWLQDISDIVTKVPGVRAELQDPAGVNPYPTMVIEWDPERTGITAGEVYDQLLAGEPRIMSHASGDGYSFRVRPPAIRPGDQVLAGRRIAEVLRKAPRGVTEKGDRAAGRRSVGSMGPGRSPERHDRVSFGASLITSWARAGTDRARAAIPAMPSFSFQPPSRYNDIGARSSPRTSPPIRVKRRIASMTSHTASTSRIAATPSSSRLPLS